MQRESWWLHGPGSVLGSWYSVPNTLNFIFKMARSPGLGSRDWISTLEGQLRRVAVCPMADGAGQGGRGPQGAGGLQAALCSRHLSKATQQACPQCRVAEVPLCPCECDRRWWPVCAPASVGRPARPRPHGHHGHLGSWPFAVSSLALTLGPLCHLLIPRLDFP